MQIFDSATDVTTGNEWCLWLGTQAWAWARSGQPLQSQPWPDGEPPLEMPFELLGVALSASFTGSESKPVPVRLVCARWVDGAATDWWPDRKRAVRRWREWLASQGLSLIEVTRADGRQDEEQPGKPHDPRATIWQARQRFSGLLPATAGGRLVASMLAAAVMHVALAQVLRPAWEHHLAQNRRQAELAEQERLDQENQQRQHALNEEKTRQRQLWVQEQFRGMTPWNEFARFMGARPHRGSPQLWTGLRWTSGHWTVTGVTLHEPEPGLWQPSLADVGVVANLIAAPTSWPSEPARGWPAWRFQWQFEAAQASPAKEAP